MRTLVGSLVLAACLCFAGPALSLIIDDFENGDFTVVDVAPGPTSGQQAGLSPFVLGGTRHVFSNATAEGTTTASLTTTPGPDAAILSFSDAGAPFGQGDVAFFYDGIPNFAVDGTSGALNVDLSVYDAVYVEASVIPGIASVQLTLWDAAQSEASLVIALVNGVTQFNLASFTAVDLTDINTIRVRVFGLDPGESANVDRIYVPEPGTAFLVAVGLAGLAFRRTRTASRP